MPKRSRRLGPRWTIPGKLALKAKWQTDREAMLARSKAGTEASRRTYADRLATLRDFVSSWPAQLTMKDIRGRIEADRLPGERRSADSIVRRMREHDLIAFDLVSGLWQNLCRVAPKDEPQNL